MAEPEGKLVAKAKIPEVVGLPTPDHAKKWWKQQVPYANFAGRNNDLDEKVRTFVQQIRERFYQRISSVQERWETIWDAVNGDPHWGEFEDDIHVPETQKKLRAKTARVYEAINDFDPVFEVEGATGELSRWKAQVIGSWVYRNMELANWKRFVEPAASDLEICNVAALKLMWDVRYHTVVDRKWERQEGEDGKVYWNDERRMRDAVTMQLKYRQVDPFLFLYDIDCADLDSDDCAFVGDESDQFLHDLQSMAETGMFSKKMLKEVMSKRKEGITASSQTSNIDGVSSTTQTSDGGWQDIRRASRNIAQASIFGQDAQNDNQPHKIRCCEIWGWFDFGDGYDGITDPMGRRVTGPQKIVVTTAQGIPIQFRLNPLDKKFHPYAIGRLNENGHEAVAPSNFEQVIQVNAQYDGFRSNVLRHAHLTVSPLGITSGEWPGGTLTGVKPGTIFSNVNQFQEIRVGDLPQSVQYMEGSFRREIEETSGVLNVFESPQGTATETERKVQEQQRSIRKSVMATGRMLQSLAKKSHFMLAQFSTGPQRFPIAGKASKALTKQFEITPDLMQEDVNFRFLGVENLHVFGNRQAGLSQWMQRYGPLLPSIPGFNLMAMLRMDFELTVGKDRVQEIFPDDEPDWAAWPQTEENEMLLQGISVPTSSRDDDEQHMQDMLPLIKRAKTDGLPMYVKTAIAEHYAAHALQRDKKAAEEKAQMKQSMQQQMLLGGRPGVDKAPTPGGMEAMTKAQEPGTTPGPTQARTVSKPGRDGGGMSQSQKMGAA